jgi:hypothetical protein
MTTNTKLQCRTWWVLLPLLLGWGCAGGYGGDFPWAETDSGSNGGGGNDIAEGSDSFAGGSDSFMGGADGFVGGADGFVGDSGAPPCQPSCAGKTCGAPDGCGGTCQAGSGCCTPSCSGKLCGASDGCGGKCSSGSGCCTPSCTGKSCGSSDGCGGTCSAGSGCATTCGTWQAVNPGDPWDAADPNYDGERRCNGSLIKDFGKVSTEAACRKKCAGVAATCCTRDHRGGHKSCKAYGGKVVTASGCTGCTAASCK